MRNIVSESCIKLSLLSVGFAAIAMIAAPCCASAMMGRVEERYAKIMLAESNRIGVAMGNRGPKEWHAIRWIRQSDGKTQWTARLRHEPREAVLASGNRIILGSSLSVVAINHNDGNVIWEMHISSLGGILEKQICDGFGRAGRYAYNSTNVVGVYPFAESIAVSFDLSWRMADIVENQKHGWFLLDIATGQMRQHGKGMIFASFGNDLSVIDNCGERSTFSIIRGGDAITNNIAFEKFGWPTGYRCRVSRVTACRHSRMVTSLLEFGDMSFIVLGSGIVSEITPLLQVNDGGWAYNIVWTEYGCVVFCPSNSYSGSDRLPVTFRLWSRDKGIVWAINLQPNERIDLLTRPFFVSYSGCDMGLAWFLCQPWPADEDKVETGMLVGISLVDGCEAKRVLLPEGARGTSGVVVADGFIYCMLKSISDRGGSESEFSLMAIPASSGLVGWCAEIGTGGTLLNQLLDSDGAGVESR